MPQVILNPFYILTHLTHKTNIRDRHYYNPHLQTTNREFSGLVRRYTVSGEETIQTQVSLALKHCALKHCYYIA